MAKENSSPDVEVGLKGKLFGLPEVFDDDADVVIVPVCWDVTTSYKPGTSKAPAKIVDVSSQLDYFVKGIKDTTSITYAVSDKLDHLKGLNDELRPDAERIISALENGEEIEEGSELAQILEHVNNVCEDVSNQVHQVCKEYLDKGKTVVLLGGDHSTPLGYIKALAEKHEEFGVLHIDAHADLRVAFEGFKRSHASIMYNVSEEVPQVSKIVQVGQRDMSEDEVEYAKNSNGRIDMYQDEDISDRLIEGENWKDIVDEIVNKLPQKVYISFDIDGLTQADCPSTGTPVPGGLKYQQAIYLIKKVMESGRTIIGADLNEVGPEEWDCVVGMRMLFRLCVTTACSQGKLKMDV